MKLREYFGEARVSRCRNGIGEGLQLFVDGFELRLPLLNPDAPGLRSRGASLYPLTQPSGEASFCSRPGFVPAPQRNIGKRLERFQILFRVSVWRVALE